MQAKEFLKNITRYCIPSIFSAIVGIIAIPIISKIYSTSDYGKINLFYSVGNMLLYIVLLGLDSAYIRFYFEPPKGFNKDKLFALSLYIGLLNTLIIACVSSICFPEIVSNYLFGEVNRFLIILMAVYIIGLILFRLLSIETRMENKAFMFNLQQILLIVTNRVSFVLIAFFTTDYRYSIAAISISSLGLGMVFYFIQKGIKIISLNGIKYAFLKDIFLFAIPLMPTMVMTWINNSAAKMILSGYGAFELLGIFSIATSLANVFSIIPSAFGTYWSPFMYSNYNTQQEFIKKVHNYILLLSLGMVLAVFSMQDILYFFVNGEYRESQPYFLLIMLSPIQSLLCETTSYGINLQNKTKFNLYVSLLAGGFNILACILLYPIFKIWGIVVGISGASLIQLIVKTVIGQKMYVSIEKKFKTYMGYLLIVVLCISNIVAYKNYQIRLLFVVLIGFTAIFLFRKDIISAISLISKLKKRKVA